VTRLLDAGFLPVVSPISSDNLGQLLNINSDTVAAAIGGALVAEKLILCTGAPGILERLDDPHSLISYTDVAGLRRLREEGALSDGMLPKASAIEAAIRGGVRRVHVISYNAADALLADLHERGHRHARGCGYERTGRRAGQRGELATRAHRLESHVWRRSGCGLPEIKGRPASDSTLG
jgi:acetylglutamate kinase